MAAVAEQQRILREVEASRESDRQTKEAERKQREEEKSRLLADFATRQQEVLDHSFASLFSLMVMRAFTSSFCAGVKL